MKTKILLIVTCFVITSVFSQVNLNEYKYVIVSKKYDFLKTEDQYQLNSLSKFLFNKYGFEAYMEGEDYPLDLIENRCLALKADMFSKPKFMRSRVLIKLADCNDKVVYTSEYGESRLKDFDKSFVEATREAFNHVERLKHKYTPKKMPKITPKKTKTLSNELAGVLYAQAISKGYQIVDSTPKVVMVLIASDEDDAFVVEGVNAKVFKEEGVWYYAENNNEKRVLNLKF